MRRFLLLFFVAIGLSLVIALPAMASPFLVSKMRVETRNTREDIARTQSLQKAVRQGFLIVIRRLLPDQEWEHFQEQLPTLKTMHSLVDSQRIEAESFGGGIYNGTISVSFREENIATFMRARGYRYSGVATRPMLVFPIITTEGDGTIIFPLNRNPLFRSLRASFYREGLVALHAPAATQRNQANISPQAVQSQARALAAQAGFRDYVVMRYNAADHSLQYRISSHGFPSPTRRTVRGESLRSALAIAYSNMQTDWRTTLLFDPAQSHQTQVTLHLAEDDPLNQWRAAIDTIEAMHFVEQVRWISLAGGGGEIELAYRAAPEGLLRLFAWHGFEQIPAENASEASEVDAETNPAETTLVFAAPPLPR